MAQSAILVVLVYWAVYILEINFLSWQCLTRPIVIAPLTGLVLGDFHTGIVMGASLEAIFMGISAIGGSVAADATTSSVIAVAYTILTGADVEAGLAIALPIGTLMSSFSSMTSPIFASLAPYWEKLATTDIKKFKVQTILFGVFITPLINCIVLFVSIAYGIEGLSNLLGSMPAWVMTGLGAATGMMLAVGFAILTSMIWSADVAVFFFVGYVLAKFMALDTVAIAVLGAAVAITMFMSEKRIIDLKNSLSNNSSNNSGEEDFF